MIKLYQYVITDHDNGNKKFAYGFTESDVKDSLRKALIELDEEWWNEDEITLFKTPEGERTYKRYMYNDEYLSDAVTDLDKFLKWPLNAINNALWDATIEVIPEINITELLERLQNE